jgi:hypothetical protein
MMTLRRLPQPLVAGIICGTVIVLLILAVTLFSYLNPQHNQLDLVLFSALILAFFLPMFIPVSGASTLLLPFALWFIIGYLVSSVTHSNRATLFICIGLFVLDVLCGLAFLKLLTLIL